MTNYLVMAYVLLFPVIIAGGIFLTQYMRIRMFSSNSFVFDVVSARRIGYMLLKFVGVLAQIFGFAYLLRVFFAKVVGIGFSYPLLVDSSIVINEKTFLYSDLVLGLIFLILGAILVMFATMRLRKLDARNNTFLDRVYSYASKLMLVYLAIFPLFFGIQEMVIYATNEKYPAVEGQAVAGQNVNIFQIVDYVNGGGSSTTTTLFAVKGINAPGASMALGLSFVFALLLMKITSKVMVKKTNKKSSVSGDDDEVVTKSKKTVTKTTKKSK